MAHNHAPHIQDLISEIAKLKRRVTINSKDIKNLQEAVDKLNDRPLIQPQ